MGGSFLVGMLISYVFVPLPAELGLQYLLVIAQAAIAAFGVSKGAEQALARLKKT